LVTRLRKEAILARELVRIDMQTHHATNVDKLADEANLSSEVEMETESPNKQVRRYCHSQVKSYMA
jgi:hypothetical protein